MLRQSTTDAAMDPFLSGINEQHARQESADSGLGLGSAYSLPHTPEDFLANIDDNMDGTSGKINCFTFTVRTCRDKDDRRIRFYLSKVLKAFFCFFF